MNLYLVALTMTTLTITHVSYTTATSETLCNKLEKHSLLGFKTGLVDPSNRLASWVGGGNCCDWYGVVCHNLTGHVLELHLGGNGTYSTDSERSFLGGRISNSLRNLRQLRYLDLSNNDFGGGRIPEFLGSMQSLRVLNLSSSGFGGMVPPQLGNLSNLLYLNIGQGERYDIHVDNLQWLSGLSMLKHLDMNNVYLSDASNWVQQISVLPSLKELHLQWCDCDLGNAPPLTNTNLSSLEILDLSHNPEVSSYSFLEMFHSLVSLDTSDNWIRGGGALPGVLQNLTSLRDLILSNNDFNSSLPDWIYNLTKLEKLMLGGNHLQGVLSDGIGNLSFLTHLDVSYTSLQLDVTGSLRTLCNLQWLDLTGITLGQELTYLLETTLECSSRRLQHLSLSDCGLSGPIPQFIGSLTSLDFLDLSDNRLDGTIPASAGQLFQLEHLDMGNNSLQGTVSEALLSNLTRLEVLAASHNQISWRAGSDWVPPFQLTRLELSSWLLGPDFPEWLRSQDRLSYLELGGTRIKDKVPTWFWDRSSQFSHINLTSNSLYGDISEVILSAQGMDLSSNSFEGLLPFLSSKPLFLDLSNNSFSGSVSQLLCYKEDEDKHLEFMILGNNQLSGAISDCWTSWPDLGSVDLQKNILTGNIPSSIGSLSYLMILMLSNNSLSGEVPRFLQNCSSLRTLDLSHNLLSGPVSPFLCNASFDLEISFLMLGNNQLSGNIPDCWRSFPNLQRLELQENEFTGHLPDSIGSMKQLAWMHLQKNNLSGELPSSLQNCSSLEILDIGENKFGGRLPKWIGESFVNIRIMRLRSNNFVGIIPTELCGLQRLQTLDIANNNLSGYIPKCIFNLTGMANESGFEEPLGLNTDILNYSFPHPFDLRKDGANLVSKGSSQEYTSILRYTVFLDLSNNSLSGHIPGEITNLAALISLNLSSNMLGGRIPKNMGNMTSLESLDLSFNRLSGEIPQSMASMTALSFLNLSYNNLTGTIPMSTQFSTFSQSSFLGNNLNVSNNSSRNESSLADDDDHGLEFNEMYVSALLGFVVGFGIVVAPLLYSHSWRVVYFRTIGSILGRLWELVLLPVRIRFRRQI